MRQRQRAREREYKDHRAGRECEWGVRERVCVRQVDEALHGGTWRWRRTVQEHSGLVYGVQKRAAAEKTNREVPERRRDTQQQETTEEQSRGQRPQLNDWMQRVE